MRTKVVCTVALMVMLFVGVFVPPVGSSMSSGGILNSPEGWSEDIRLTEHQEGWDTIARIVSWENTVHLVWRKTAMIGGEYRDITSYMRSENNGLSWTDPINISNPGTIGGVDIAVHEDNVYVVWHHWYSGAYEIFFRRSLDGGDTWEEEQQITHPTGEWKTGPSIAVSDDGMIVHVAWIDARHGGDLDTDIYYVRSLDGGLTWEEEVRITDAPWHSTVPRLAVDGETVHLVWYDERKGYMLTDIYYRRSTDNGATWDEEVALSDSPNSEGDADVAVWEGNVHVVWYEIIADQDYAINYRHSTDGGDTWEPMQVLTAPSALVQGPRLAVKENDVHVVWYDDRDGGHEIYYKYSWDSGNSWDVDTRLTYTANSISAWPVISLSGDIIHLAWYDDRDGDHYEIYYKRNPDFNDDPIPEFATVVIPVLAVLVTYVGIAEYKRWKKG